MQFAVHCNFGTNLTRALRDQFVVGVRSRSTRKKLLSEDRTFDQALYVAQADELAEKESKELLLSAERTEAPQVHSISNKKKYSFKGGDANKAKYFEQGKLVSDVDLHNIWRTSAAIHIQHEKKAESNAKAHNIVATPTDESSDSVGDLDSVNGTPVTIFIQSVNSVGQKYKLGVNINGREVSMEIDTGRSVPLLNSSDLERMGGNTKLKPATVLFISYTGNEIKCYGEDNMKVKVGEQVSDIKIRVVEGPSLLGRVTMTKFRLPWHNIFSVVPTTAEDIIQQYPELVDERKAGKLKGYVQVSLRVNDDIPVFMKPRVVPFEKVEHSSEWSSPTVPVIKPNGNIRICGDYSGCCVRIDDILVTGETDEIHMENLHRVL
ncbi:Hypothetical predicted protein [Paramuricea clavata]|uniref:Uncharacterized protein n=1 Tax=Paramuricea clavata TaxID=317549 RepID=A0A6S7LN49_PARCT|nr:Hypothetical predicted protein [Paramuricea clavata]